MKKIVFINQYYDPIKNPPAKRIKAFSEYLANNNWKVNIITGMPNYPNGKTIKKYKKKIYCKEKLNKNLTVHRFFEIPLKIKGFWRPLINYTSFAITSISGWNIIRKSNIVYISTPPTFSAITTFYLSRILNKRIILEVRDLYPETAEELGLIKKNSLSYKLFKRINQRMFSKAHSVITIGNELKKEIEKNYTVKNIYVITNFAEIKKVRKQKSNRKITIAYTGVITDAQELEKIIELNKNSNIKNKFIFEIVGDGNKFSQIEKLIKKNNYDNIRLWGYKNKKFCDEIIKQSDIGLITLADKKIFKSAMPSKFFEYLSFGKPVIVNQTKQIKEIIQQSNCGWFLERNKEIKTLISITKKQIKNKGNNAKKMFFTKFEKDIVCEKLKIICEEEIKK